MRWAPGVGGGLGLPLFMCSACSAPVSLGLYRAGAALETTFGMILGSALFNPVGILAVFLLMPPQTAVARVVFGLLMIFALVPLIARLHERAAARRAPDSDETGAVFSAAARSIECSIKPPAGQGWAAALKDGLVEWGRATSDHAVRLVPPMAAASLAVGAVFMLAPPQGLSDAVGSGVAATVAAAALGTLIQLPTLFEIPLVLGELGWRAPGLLLVGTFAGGLAGGLVVGAL